MIMILQGNAGGWEVLNVIAGDAYSEKDGNWNGFCNPIRYWENSFIRLWWDEKL